MGEKHWFACAVMAQKSNGVDWGGTAITALLCHEALSIEEAKGRAVTKTLQEYPGYSVTGVLATRVPPESP